jgi:DNA-binding YbaB/EbfC family protein
MAGGYQMRRPSTPNPKDIMRQVQEMQAQMLAEQEALSSETLEVSVGGGAVTVVMNGHQKLQSVRVKPELLDPEEAEMLSDLLVAAVNEAVDRTQAIAQERMGAITKGLSLPPGLGL